MPHFTVDCSENLLSIHGPEKILQSIHQAAQSSGLFAMRDIKVRIQSFNLYTVAGGKSDFIHVFGNIMEGRSILQRKALSESIVKRLLSLFPDVPVISMNVREFERATYCNRSLV